MASNAFQMGLLSLLVIPTLAACSDEDDHDHGNEGEVITTVSLSFTPTGGGAPIVAAFRDIDGDGGNAPVIDAIALPAGDYTTSVTLLNELEMPAGDITVEVRDEGDQHQVFFTGTAVNGPASNQPLAPLTHAYADMDVNGLPIGLVHTVTAAPGTGTLTVTLRHMPPINNEAVKTATSATTVKDSGFAAIGGENDVSVNFTVTNP